MLIGYNNDVQYRGKVFHIQTEDRGSPAMQIETQIFHAGAILDTRILSYEELVESEEEGEARNKSIKSLMQKTHKELYRNLFTGHYDHFVGLEARAAKEEAEEEAEEEPSEDFTPSQDRVPDAARALEEGGSIDEELERAAGGDHIDLQSLKSRLAKMSSEAAAGSQEEEEEEEDLDEAATLLSSSDHTGVLKPVLSLSKRAASASGASKPPPVIRPGALASSPSVSARSKEEAPMQWEPTGAKAWQGCEPPRDPDLSVLALIEKLL